MPHDRIKRVEDLFNHAADLSPRRRIAFLDAECADDTGLRREVELLLRHDATASDRFLEGEVELPAPRAGDTIGHYTLVHRLGSGGFGEVWLAEQHEPIRRPVAIKIIKLGMDTREVVARFEIERQALALMDHPNIAHVFDAGSTAEGRPYFVMEVVRGLPITEFCDRREFRLRERLELFMTVCDAVQHAHQKGVIHRDLKPSNVLVVTPETSTVAPIPKIIDFGIAKAAGPRLTNLTLVTAIHQFIGTPQYMSPEHLAMSPAGVDTRSDVYSLGVMLYELLTGSTPFELGRAGAADPAEFRRIVREEQPPRPSTRIGMLARTTRSATSQDAGAADTIKPRRPVDEVARARRCNTDELRRSLRGDLDWIAMKAIEKEPARRYPTAESLREDIQRYLLGRPVLASAPGRLYQARKFVQRNRGAVILAASVLLALILGLAGTSWQAIRATLAEEDARNATAQERQRSIELDIARQGADRLAYRASITGAAAALGNDDFPTARDLLRAAPEPHRGWEWRYLHLLSDRAVATLRGHAGTPSLAASHDGLRLYTLDDARILREWDPASGTILLEKGLTLPATYFGLLCLIDSVLVAEHLGDVHAIDARTGEALWNRSFPSLVALEPAHGADHLVCARTVGAREFLDVRTGQTVTPESPLSLAPGRTIDGKHVIEYSHYALIEFRDAASGAAREAGPGIAWCYEPRNETALAFDATSDPERPVIKEVALNALRTSVRCIIEFDNVHWGAFLPDRTILVAQNSRRVLAAFDTYSGERTASLESVPGVSAPCLLPAAGLVAAPDNEGQVRVFDAFTCEIDTDYRTIFGAQQAVVDPQCTAITLGGWGDVWSHNASTSELYWRVSISRFMRAPLAAHDSVIAASDEDGEVFLLDPATGTITASRRPRASESKTFISSLDFSRDGRTLFAGWSDGRLERLHPLTLAALPSELEPLTEKIVHIATDTHARLLAIVTPSRVQIRDAETFAVKRELPAIRENWSTCAFNSDGTALAIGGPLSLVVASLRTDDQDTVQCTMTGVGALAVAWFDGDTRLAAACTDGAVRIFESATGTALLSLPIDSAGGCAVAFDARTQSLLAATYLSFRRFETSPPSRGYESRLRWCLAARIVDSFFEGAPLSEDCVRMLEGDSTLDPDVRDTAVLYARRFGDPMNSSNSRAWGVVNAPGRPAATYEQARRLAEAALRWRPSDPAILNTLGVAQYRCALYDEALVTLARSSDAYTRSGRPINPGNLLFVAACHAHLGRLAAAQEAWESARKMLATPQWSSDPEVHTFVKELQLLIENSGL
jgi:serine/threonine protein kinase/outer membrane protein assembly factor BamB